MKKLLKGLLGFAVVGGSVFALVMHMTSGMVEATDGFFQAVKHQDLAKARSFLAQETSQKLDDAALRKLMESDALARYKESSFPNRKISGGRGELNGTLKTTTGGVLPVRVVLVQETGMWKLYGFQTAK